MSVVSFFSSCTCPSEASYCGRSLSKLKFFQHLKVCLRSICRGTASAWCAARRIHTNLTRARAPEQPGAEAGKEWGREELDGKNYTRKAVMASMNLVHPNIYIGNMPAACDLTVRTHFLCITSCLAGFHVCVLPGLSSRVQMLTFEPSLAYQICQGLRRVGITHILNAAAQQIPCFFPTVPRLELLPPLCR